MKGIRSVIDLWRLAWLRFLRDTSLPMSPYLPAIVLKINRIEQRRK